MHHALQAGDCEETVEKHLFEGLRKVKLIEDRASSCYSRCGRTDSGVSAFGQVVCIGDVSTRVNNFLC